MILQGNNIHRRAGVAVLTSDKVDFKITKVRRDKDGYFIMIKGIYVKKTKHFLIYVYAPNEGALKYMKQLLTELKGGTNENTAIVGDLNTTLTALYRSSKQEINRNIGLK